MKYQTSDPVVIEIKNYGSVLNKQTDMQTQIEDKKFARFG